MCRLWFCRMFGHSALFWLQDEIPKGAIMVGTPAGAYRCSRTGKDVIRRGARLPA